MKFVRGFFFSVCKLWFVVWVAVSFCTNLAAAGEDGRFLRLRQGSASPKRQTPRSQIWIAKALHLLLCMVAVRAQMAKGTVLSVTLGQSECWTSAWGSSSHLDFGWKFGTTTSQIWYFAVGRISSARNVCNPFEPTFQSVQSCWLALRTCPPSIYPR